MRLNIVETEDAYLQVGQLSIEDAFFDIGFNDKYVSLKPLSKPGLLFHHNIMLYDMTLLH